MRILALDIGSFNIKAVEIEISFGRIELANYIIEKITEPTPNQQTATDRKILTEGQRITLSRILNNLYDASKTTHDRLVIGIPKAWVTTRIFQFPTKDRRVINSSLNFELDDDIPVSMTDIIYDFVNVKTETNSSTVFAAVALKSDIIQLVSELQMVGLDPDMITVESWAFHHLLKKAIPKEYEGRPIGIINLGASQSSVHLFVGSDPVLTHISQCGGYDITKAIAVTYSLGFEEAEKAKIDGGFLITQTHLKTGTNFTNDQKRFSKVIEETLMPLIRETKQTLMAYKSQQKLVPRAIFITGGTSLISNIPLFLEEQLQIPVFPLNYISKIVGQTLQLSESSEAMISQAIALSTTVIKMDKSDSVNLRKDELEKKTGFGVLDLKNYKKSLLYLAGMIGFIYLTLIAQWVILSARIPATQTRVERAIKSVLGPVGPSTLNTYLNSTSALKASVDKEFAKYKETEVATIEPQLSALKVLNKVSSAIPKNITLDTNFFEIKEGKLKMTGLVDSFISTDRIAKALEETKFVTDIVKNKTEMDPKTKKIRFEISAKITGESNVKNQ